MRLRKIISLTMAVCMIFGLSACTKKEDPTAVKVKVNDKDITVGEFNKTLSDYMGMYESRYGEEFWDKEIEDGKTYKQYLEEMVLDTLILEIVLVDEATKKGLEVSEEALQTEFKKYKEYFTSTEDYNKFLKDSGMTEKFLLESIEKELLITEFLSMESEKIDKLEPTDEELRALFNERTDIFKKIKVSHILVETEKEAKDIKKKLDEGGNFEELAKEFSKCTSAENGGDLEYLADAEMYPEFSEVAFKMQIGEISNPVKTNDGYHIIKVTDVKDTYDKIDQEELIFQYKAIKYNEMLDAYVANAKIEK